MAYGILERMVSGELRPTAERLNFDSTTIDPTIESIINDSKIPLGVMIESMHTDTHSGIMLALETFELETCIGAARVISENADASVLMENAVKRFFSAIIDKVRQFWEWIKGIFSKLFKRAKEQKEGEKAAELEKIATDPDFADDLENAPDEEFYKIDLKSGGGKAAKIMDAIFTTLESYTNLVQTLQKEFASYITNSKAHYDETKSGNGRRYESGNPFDNDTSSEDEAQENDVWSAVAKTAGVRGRTKEDVLEEINVAFGRGKNARPVSIKDLKPQDVISVAKELRSGADMKMYEREKQYVDGHVKNLLKTLDQMDRDSTKYVTDKGKSVGLQRFATRAAKLTSKITAIGSVVATILNHVASVYTSVLNSYTAMAKRLHNGRNGATTESFDYTVFMESKDSDDDAVPEDDKESGGSKDVSEGYGSTDSVLNAFINGYV